MDPNVTITPVKYRVYADEVVVWKMSFTSAEASTPEQALALARDADQANETETAAVINYEVVDAETNETLLRADMVPSAVELSGALHKWLLELESDPAVTKEELVRRVRAAAVRFIADANGDRLMVQLNACTPA